jgi:hypothetical protein
MAAASSAADAAWHKPERYFKSSFFIHPPTIDNNQCRPWQLFHAPVIMPSKRVRYGLVAGL